MYEVTVDLCDTLTPKSCPKLVIHLIKYILYHAEQIPMNYDALNNILKKFQTNVEWTSETLNTLSKMKTHKIYKSIDLFLSSCERTFEYLEYELKESKGIRELVIIVGATVLSPKRIIRIIIPNMSFSECENSHPLGRNLHSLCKHIVTSDSVHDYFRDKIGPTNIFIFIKMHSSLLPKTEWFLLKENFRFSRIGRQIKINLKQPESNGCSCTEPPSREHVLDRDLLKGCDKEPLAIPEDLFTWYQSKGSIKGLREINGKAASSVFSLLLKHKS